MKRRAFLGGAGAALSAGLVGRTALGRSEELHVRVWFSTAADEYDAVRARVRGYLRAALEPPVDRLRVELVENPVALPAEGGRQVLARHWLGRVVRGAGGLGDVDPVGGVNLLVTDGDPTAQPAGFARPHVAATTGAAALSRLPPAETSPAAVDYSIRAAAAQLLLHECGHALGLSHGHGSATEDGTSVSASPMVGSYLWAGEDVRRSHLGDSDNACGDSLPPAGATGQRRLELRYSACAIAALRSELL